MRTLPCGAMRVALTTRPVCSAQVLDYREPVGRGLRRRARPELEAAEPPPARLLPTLLHSARGPSRRRPRGRPRRLRRPAQRPEDVDGLRRPAGRVAESERTGGEMLRPPGGPRVVGAARHRADLGAGRRHVHPARLRARSDDGRRRRFDARHRRRRDLRLDLGEDRRLARRLSCSCPVPSVEAPEERRRSIERSRESTASRRCPRVVARPKRGDPPLSTRSRLSAWVFLRTP